MTEFIITLPIFLILFQGILTLGEMQRRSVAVKIEASHEMWDNAVTIQTEVFDQLATKYVHPANAGSEAVADLNHISNTFPGNAADGVARTKNLAQAARGHYGESYLLLRPLSATPGISINNGNIYNHADNHLPTGSFASGQVDDAVVPSFPSSPSGLGDLTNNWSPSDLANGFRQSLGAGIRYGVATGDARDTRSLDPIGSYDMRAAYDTLAAPRSLTATEELISVGISRVAAEERCALSNTLGISFNQRLSGC